MSENKSGSSSIFRKESIERISSADQLDDYIRVQKPSVWILLMLVVALLVAAFVWAGTTKLETTVTAFGIMDSENSNDTVTCYLTPDKAEIVKIGQATILSYDKEYQGTVTAVSGPYSFKEIATDFLDGNTYAVYMADIREGNNYYQVTIQGKNLPGGAFDVTIIGESVSPISFLFN
ncbi:MAG: hypothetical protein ABFC73_06635 [Clostridiaceae bacterium]